MAMIGAVALPTSLDEARITGLPSHAFYIPNFISDIEEELLLSKISSAPISLWTQLRHRRLQTYPSKLSAHDVLEAAPLPSWLHYPVIPRLQTLSLLTLDESLDGHHHVFSSSPHRQPNHVLVNEYERGQGIMPHEDGGAYWPVVATVSLGAPIVLDVYEKGSSGRKEERPKHRIIQEARSLLIMTEGLYTDHLHGIAETTLDEDLKSDTIANWPLLGAPEAFASGKSERQTRTSLTYRDVRKVSAIEARLRRLCGR